MRPRRAAELGQAQAVGLPQANTLVQVAGGNPLFNLFATRRILFDPGQAQVEQGVAVIRVVGQRLYRVLVASLFGQRLHQQGSSFVVFWHFAEQVPHQPFDFGPVAFFRLAIAAVHVGETAELLKIGQWLGLHPNRDTQAQQQADDEKALTIAGLHSTSLAMAKAACCSVA
ncbi:hypothetical protein D3C85_1090550 [compost metagenome]